MTRLEGKSRKSRKMNQIILQAKKSITLGIAISTMVAITIFTLFMQVTIPRISKDMVFSALVFAAIPTWIMITIHTVAMNRRWKETENFLSDKPENRSPDQADRARAAMKDFHVSMPVWGFVAWLVGGLAATVGTMVANDFQRPITEAWLFYFGIIFVSLLAFAIQYFKWPRIIAPVLEAIEQQARKPG